MTIKKKFPILLLFVCSGFSLGVAQKVSVVSPRVEMQENPLGIDRKDPHFSWQLKSGMNDVQQTGYEIQMGTDLQGLKRGNNLMWQSGLVSSDHMQVGYQGSPLQSGKEYY